MKNQSKEKKIPFLTSIKKHAIEKIFNSGNEIPITTRQTIPIKKIYRDGLCELENGIYSKTIEFFDITYQLSSTEVKNDILDKYCELLNSFSEEIKAQFSFVNQTLNITDYEDAITIPKLSTISDDFDYLREEYSEILRNQFEKGNNSIIKRKFLTLSTKAKSIKEARQKLDQAEITTLSNFNRLGVRAYCLNGNERLSLLSAVLANDYEKHYTYDWRNENEDKIELISPNKIVFKKNYFKLNKSYGVTSAFHIISSHLNDEILMDMLNVDTNITVNIHITPMEQNKALKLVRQTITSIDAMKLEEQKKANRNMYGEDLIPQHLIISSDDSKKLLKQLLQSDVKYFFVTILVTNYADSKNQLEVNFNKSNSIAERSTNRLFKLDYIQEKGYISSLPLGLNEVSYLDRGLTTYPLAIMEPFITQELFQQSKQSLYYGLNALSHNMIMCDRKLLLNPNGLILGKPGTGKSFSAKREIVNVFFSTNDPIFICDPEGEYSPLVKALGGQVVTFSSNSTDYINPLDISNDYDAEGNPIALKSSFMLSFFELIMHPHIITPIDKGIIDDAVQSVCEKYLVDPEHRDNPILSDIYNYIAKNDDSASQFLVDSMKFYVTGNNNFFNHPTSVNLNNRVICFDIKELSDQLKPLAMLIIQDFVWSRVSANRKRKINTWFYIDEFHLLLSDKETAEYSVAIWKRFRKWGGIPTGITQNVKDFLQSAKVENIFENTDFIYMLGQGPHDKELLSEKLGISENQLNYLSTSDTGKGLLKYGNIILPFEDVFPRDTKLYELITTKLSEVK